MRVRRALPDHIRRSILSTVLMTIRLLCGDRMAHGTPISSAHRAMGVSIVLRRSADRRAVGISGNRPSIALRDNRATPDDQLSLMMLKQQFARRRQVPLSDVSSMVAGGCRSGSPKAPRGAAIGSLDHFGSG